jgi:hypothetical protein
MKIPWQRVLSSIAAHDNDGKYEIARPAHHADQQAEEPNHHAEREHEIGIGDRGIERGIARALRSTRDRRRELPL